MKPYKLNIDKLQAWYIENHRQLPFRETHDAYQIWVSEIMLQQTQVDTVIPYFERFINKYPTVNDLAETAEETLLHLVQGLGYYRRFKNMLKAAKIIQKDYDGYFPKAYAAIKSLPGVGNYTAGAISSIAYNLPVSATDGNVIRVLSRFFDIEKDMRLEKNKKEIESINQQLIEEAKPQIYTQAIMELGALVCKPQNPLCSECPLNNECIALQSNKQEVLPYLSKKPKQKKIKYNTFIIVIDGQLVLRKRTESLLGGMYEFPQFESNIPFEYQITHEIGLVKHVFTHLIWEMNVLEIKLQSELMTDWILVPLANIEKYPMSTAHKKIIKKWTNF